MFSLEKQKDSLEVQVGRLSPEAGDILFLRFPRKLRQEEAHSLNVQVMHLAGRIKKDITFFLLEDGASMEVVSTSKLRDAA